MNNSLSSFGCTFLSLDLHMFTISFLLLFQRLQNYSQEVQRKYELISIWMKVCWTWMLLFLCWLRHDWDILDVETCLKDCWIVLSYCCSPSFLLCNSLFSRSSLFLWNSSFTRFSIFISSCYSCYENNSKCSRIIRIIAFFLPVISFFIIFVLFSLESFLFHSFNH